MNKTIDCEAFFHEDSVDPVMNALWKWISAHETLQCTAACPSCESLLDMVADIVEGHREGEPSGIEISVKVPKEPAPTLSREDRQRLMALVVERQNVQRQITNLATAAETGAPGATAVEMADLLSQRDTLDHQIRELRAGAGVDGPFADHDMRGMGGEATEANPADFLHNQETPDVETTETDPA